MSTVGIKKYVGVSLFISCGLSVIKGFKYTVNYEGDEKSFPIPNEFDIFNHHVNKPTFLDGFFIVNSLFDILNYVVSMIICMIIDIVMVVKLRTVLEEKKAKSKKLKTSSQQNKEYDEAVNKAIKMVVINTAINLLFKIPIAFLPTLSVYAQFYRKNENFLYEKPKFKEFYILLVKSGSYVMFDNLSDLFFCFSISIQFFIYRCFDFKFRNGLEALFKKK